MQRSKQKFIIKKTFILISIVTITLLSIFVISSKNRLEEDVAIIMNITVFPYSCVAAPVFYNLSKNKIILLWHYNEIDPRGLKTDIMSGLLDLKRKKIIDCKFIFKNENSNEHPYLERIGAFFYLIYACRDLNKNWSVRLRKSRNLKTWSDETILVNNTIRRSMPFIYKEKKNGYYLIYTQDCKKLKGILIPIFDT